MLLINTLRNNILQVTIRVYSFLNQTYCLENYKDDSVFIPGMSYTKVKHMCKRANH